MRDYRKVEQKQVTPEEVQAVLDSHGWEIASEDDDVYSIADYINSYGENYSAEDWLYDTLRNYPEFLK